MPLLRGWLHGDNTQGALPLFRQYAFFIKLVCRLSYITGVYYISIFWYLIGLIVSTFIFIALLVVLFQIVADLFRNTEMGEARRPCDIGMAFIPILTAVDYIIAKGGGMTKRQRAAVERAKSDTDSYIRQVAGKLPAEQIADAKALLDAGTINAEEFVQLKTKALA